GIIISSDGYIVTNSHVIGDTDTYKIQIITSNKKKYEAVTVGYDTRSDLAVLKCKKAKGLPFVEFGKVSQCKIGDDVIAIGNPGGVDFQNSLTKGIISATNRSLKSSNVKCIQTDAAINPGNSGGPLCNLYGQVIGINTAKISSTDYEGMGFAIDSSEVQSVCNELIRKGYVSDRVKIGITGYAIGKESSSYYNVPSGILIEEIEENSPLASTKAKEGDIITHIDKNKVTSFSDVYSLLENYAPGDKVVLTLYRMDEKDNTKGETFKVNTRLVSEK
ncbi:MAG: S1C family serine protease, partial [Acutalibacteraceae bacterium]